MSIIRKIVIGPDYKNGMSYQLGQSLNIVSGEVKHEHKVSLIRKRDADGFIEIYAKSSLDDNPVFLWKEISPTVPCVIENNLNF